MFDVGGGRSPFSPLDGGWGCFLSLCFVSRSEDFPFFPFFGIQVAGFSFFVREFRLCIYRRISASRYYHEILALPDL